MNLAHIHILMPIIPGVSKIKYPTW